jgi:hypothetical protein
LLARFNRYLRGAIVALKHFKLGLKPVVYRKRLHLGKYVNRSTITLPSTAPLNLESSLVTPGMLANGPDPLNPPQIAGGAGCCFWAASLRAAVARKNSAGASMDLTQPWAVASVLAAYAAATGFNLNDPSTDQGTDPDQGFSFLQSTGIQLQDGSYDKIGAPVAVDPTDFDLVQIAHNLFGGLYIGVNFPSAWEDAAIWDSTNSPIEGGHEIFSLNDLSITPQGIAIDSWGKIRILTPGGLHDFCDQLTVTIDPAFLGPNGKAVNGFDAEQLQADLAAM